MSEPELTLEADRAAATPERTSPMTAQRVIRHLLERHRPPEWACFEEMANGTGGNKSRTIDLFAMNLYPSNDLRSLAYEVKVSRADFRRELDDPTKRAPWESLAHETWYAAPLGVIPVAEVPETWGLLELRDDGTWKTSRRALQRATPTWPRSFTAALARRTADPAPREPIALWEWAGRRITSSDLERIAAKFAARRRESRLDEVAALRDHMMDMKRQNRHLGEWVSTIKRVVGWRMEPAEFEAWARRRVDPAIVDDLGRARALLDKVINAAGNV